MWKLAFRVDIDHMGPSDHDRRVRSCPSDNHAKSLPAKIKLQTGAVVLLLVSLSRFCFAATHHCPGRAGTCRTRARSRCHTRSEETLIWGPSSEHAFATPSKLPSLQRYNKMAEKLCLALILCCGVSLALAQMGGMNMGGMDMSGMDMGGMDMSGTSSSSSGKAPTASKMAPAPAVRSRS